MIVPHDESVASKGVIQWSDISDIVSEILDCDGNFDLSWFELNWSFLTSSQQTYFSDLNEKTSIYLFIHTLTRIYTEFKVVTTASPTNYGYYLVNEILNNKSIIVDSFRVSSIAAQLNKNLINYNKEKLYDVAFEEIILHQKKIINNLLINHYKKLYQLNPHNENDFLSLVRYFFLDIRKGIYLYLDDEFDKFFYLTNYTVKKIEDMRNEEIGLLFAKIYEWFENSFIGIEC